MIPMTEAWAKFKVWLATSAWGTAFKVFLGLLATAALASWKASGTIQFDDWQSWIILSLTPIVPVVVNLLNDKDPRMGRGKQDPPS